MYCIYVLFDGKFAAACTVYMLYLWVSLLQRVLYNGLFVGKFAAACTVYMVYLWVSLLQHVLYICFICG